MDLVKIIIMIDSHKLLASSNVTNKHGESVFSWEIATDVWSMMETPSMVNHKKTSIIGAKFPENPPTIRTIKVAAGQHKIWVVGACALSTTCICFSVLPL